MKYMNLKVVNILLSGSEKENGVLIKVIAKIQYMAAIVEVGKYYEIKINRKLKSVNVEGQKFDPGYYTCYYRVNSIELNEDEVEVFSCDRINSLGERKTYRSVIGKVVDSNFVPANTSLYDYLDVKEVTEKIYFTRATSARLGL